ncbi:MAG TPA: phospholipid carrier-dependent glycosyltransferase [Polyangiales bacterium]|nr:phospholipid carrier-dependent glycosyltransferase [Polyangiales bacterium]
MSFLLLHLLELAGLAGLLYATGFVLEAVSGELPRAQLGAVVVRTAAGSVVWIYVLFALAALGAYRPSAAFALAGLALLSAAALALRRGIRAPRPKWRELGWAGLAALPAAVLLLVLCVRAASLGVGHDDNVYHLLLPKLYLQHGGFVRVPFNVYSHWPHNVELLFGLAMMVDDHALAKLVHTLYLGLTLLAVYRLCRVHCSRAVAGLATLLVLGNDVVLYEGTVANIDIAFAFYFLLSVAYADAYLREHEWGSLVWCGVYAGALAGTKLSGLAGLACVAGVLVLRAPGRLRDVREWQRFALCLVLPALLLPLPWYIKSALYTGNPLYPMFYRWFGGIEWSEDLGKQFFAWQHGMGMGRSWRDYALLPLRVIRDGAYDYAHFDGYLGQFWLAAVPLALFAKRARSQLLAAGLYFVFWALSSQQLRFLIAALPPLAVAAADSFEALCQRLSHRAARVSLRAAAWLATAFAAWPMLYLTLEPAQREAAQLFERGPGEYAHFVPQGYAWLNRHTPADARVLMINENRGFFLDREFLAESFPDASQINWFLHQTRSVAELRARLAELGVTHIYIRSAKHGQLALAPNLESLLADAAQARRVFVCKRKRCEIYALQ